MTFWKGLKKHKNLKDLLLALGAGAMLTLLLQNFSMNFLEAYLYDLRIRLKGQAHSSEHIVLVAIDDKTTDKLNDLPPLELTRHLQLLKFLKTAKPRAVGLMVNFGEAPSTQKANALVDLALEMNRSGTPVLVGTDINVAGEIVPPYPLSKIPHRISFVHKDGTVFAEDKVTRRAMFSISEEPTLHTQLAATITGTTDRGRYRGIYEMPQVDARYFMINYFSPTQEDLQPFPQYSAVDLIEGRVSPKAFENKIVLVGTLSHSDSSDYAYTPYSRNAFTNPKLVVHANIIETLIHGKAILKVSKPAKILITFLLISLIVFLVFRTTPAQGVLMTGGLGLLVFAGGLAMFRFFSIWIYLSYPLMGIFLAYYLFVPYRLIMEYKTRWQFQRQAEVLAQVEELKSNFMNLITHDLKTPVARIHGMAELLSRAGSDPAIVAEIIASTDELNGFINGILELAKIESNKLTPQKQSKDVNRLIEDCARKFEFQAREKGIAVKLALEPLFPVPVDSHLIAKVLGNLLDNAIKYSPEGAKVTVTSTESTSRPGFLEVSVSDTGHGIPKADQENLFTKFYRVKNDVTIKTKGTGLGLYLSRYFIELHQGTLTVRSRAGEGTTFTVFLPMEEISGEQQTPNSENPDNQGVSQYV